MIHSQIATERRVHVGLIGSGIQASLTPAMHIQEGEAQGFSYAYDLLDIDLIDGGADALPSILARAEEQGFAGVNVTHPCKQSVIPLLDRLSDDAAALGAVNTVVFSAQGRIGHNTDWWGFAESFRRGLPEVALRAVLLLGAGGAGAAVAYALLKLGVQEVAISDLDVEKGTQLVERMSKLFVGRKVRLAQSLVDEMNVVDGLVNATTVGMAKHPGTAVPQELIQSRHWVAEIVYFPLQTQLLLHAQSVGCKTLNGGGMAVYQAVEAFHLFTGVQPDVRRMLAHFDVLAAKRAK